MRTRETTNPNVPTLKTIKALASPVRLRIMGLLKEPVANFPPQVDGDLVKDGVCADFIRERGAVPNMFRTLAHDPKILQTWFEMFRATLREGEVTTRVKEMVAVRVSHLNQSRY